jgi:REP element-mobilizing transposase RayT
MKPGSFSQIYIQLVFAVKNREAVLTKNIQSHVFEYMSGIITGMKHKSIIVNGISNHVHIFIGMNPNISISDTVHDIKRNSSLLINQNRLCPGRFSWQEGYGAFSYSHSQISKVYQYIQNQELHHRKRTFQEEYLDFLHKSEIQFNPKFLFDFFEDLV